jgi:quercetin dioxygenase-like cupin family protein
MDLKKLEITPLAKTVTPAELIVYQTGSVVSREIVARTAGSVTLFAFDEGQGLSEHSAPFDALVYVLEGSVRITISGVDNEVKAGDLIIMPANDKHALKALSKFKMLLVMIRS